MLLQPTVLWLFALLFAYGANARPSLNSVPVTVHVPTRGKITIESPNYPGNYPTGLTHVYTVIAPQGSVLQFDTVDFHLEGYVPDCAFDSVLFVDVVDGVGVPLGEGRYCGEEGPGEIRTTSNVAEIHFISDADFSERGFKISVQVPPCLTGGLSCGDDSGLCVAPSKFCDGVNDCASGYDEQQCPKGCGIPVTAPALARFKRLIEDFTQGDGGRVIGGTEAVPHSWPWQASFHVAGGRHLCGASIINHEWVLTAGHCCDYAGPIPNRYEIKVGKHSLRNSHEPHAKTHRLARVVMHPGFSSDPVYQNDFCLLKTVEPIIFSSEVSPICLADHDDGPVGTKCWATGWGNTVANEGGKDHVVVLSDVLLQVDVTVSNHAKCNKHYRAVPGENFYISPEMICAEGQGKDTCQGDSGGPFVCQEGNGPFKLVGVVSWGWGCGQPGLPGVYAKTSTALDWIAYTIFS